MGKLSTHILDTASGKPAQGVKIELIRIGANDARMLIKQVETNPDGRTDGLLLDAQTIETGCYELIFYVGDYFKNQPVATSEPAFLDKVPVRFCIADTTQGYHVPLLISPWSYSTYRGS